MHARIFVSLAFVFACSGTTSPPIDASTDGGCIAPVEGQSCSKNDVACQPPGDICCVGYSWMCGNSGTWTKAAVGCACQVEAGLSDFACGPSAMCSASQQMCVDQAPGIALPDGGVPPDSYSCNALPAACATDRTCACVTAHGPCPTTVSSCEDTGGAVTVHCMGQ